LAEKMVVVFLSLGKKGLYEMKALLLTVMLLVSGCTRIAWKDEVTYENFGFERKIDYFQMTMPDGTEVILEGQESKAARVLQDVFMAGVAAGKTLIIP